HLDHLLAHRRIHRNDLVDRFAALFAQQVDESLAPLALEDVRRAQRILLPTSEILECIVQFAPGAEHDTTHLAWLPDGVIRRNRGAEGERNEDGLLDIELRDQLLQIASLVVQRKSIIGPLRPGVAATVVDKAAVVAGEIGELLIPIFHAVDLAMDETE